MKDPFAIADKYFKNEEPAPERPEPADLAAAVLAEHKPDEAGWKRRMVEYVPTNR